MCLDSQQAGVGGKIGHQWRVGLGGSGHENRQPETRGIQTRQAQT